MANVYDYLSWRGDIPLSVDPFNELDGMVLARLAYLPFDYIMEQGNWEPVRLGTAIPVLLGKYSRGAANLTKNAVNILNALNGCERFAQFELLCYINIFDEEEQIQFAAVTFRLAENSYFAAYRGTDNTLVGWKEDFNMSFVCPVPAQLQAVKYLEVVADKAVRECESGSPRFIVGGHSKGGNLAVYASAFCREDVQHRIDRVYNYDGPGFNSTVISSPGYQQICSRVTTLVPQSSIVGMLLEHEEKYTIVRSTNTSIWQHDTASWQLTRTGFTRLDSVTASSRFIDYTLKAWMESMTPERRERFCDAIYSILKDTDVTTLRELGKNKSVNLKKVLLSIRNLDEETRRDILYALKLLLKSAKFGMIRALGDKQP